ncbi:MAG: CRISPR-associated protein Cas4 [Candidatus Lokiarchaeota archaeon]|nr:CRISPR-associated protein Cas4 [Candidatus Lokiarchaeota archaeon]
MNLLLFLGIALFIFSILLFLIGKLISRRILKSKKLLRIPNGEITYTDLNVPAKPIFSKRHLLSGKPDYIMKNKESLIPVEIKSGNNSKPQKNHVLQLACYCQIIEDFYSSFTPYGILIYPNSDYKIIFNPKLRFDLENIINEMRASLKKNYIERNHDNLMKCKNCSIRNYCNQKLG